MIDLSYVLKLVTHNADIVNSIRVIYWSVMRLEKLHLKLIKEILQGDEFTVSDKAEARKLGIYLLKQRY